MRLRSLLLVAARVAGTSLRDVCLNASFAPTLEDLGEDFLAGQPRRQLKDGDAVVAALAGRRALEIGGPTPELAHVYELVASCDNLAQFPDPTHRRFELVDGGDFAPGGAPIGRTLVGDASDLTASVTRGAYDAILASHVLEHFQDPLGALLKWDRVLDEGAALLLILPWKDNTFDRYRAPHTLEQLAQKHVRAARAGDEAPLLVDFEQTVRSIDLTMDWGFEPGSSSEDLRRRTVASPEGKEMLHWHVFDFHVLGQLFECLNYRIVTMDLLAPFHQVVVGIKGPR